MRKYPRVIILGAGFGGMQTAQSLSRKSAEVLLIDRNNYNSFIPLLYQVATAQIEPEMIAYPIRTILGRATNTRFLMAEVKHIDFTHQVVEVNNAVIPYDYLVMATGSQTKFLGVLGAAENAFPLRTLAQAVRLRNHIFHCLEQAIWEHDPIQRQQLLTFVIVGGGATGVEIAGALVELKQALKKDYFDIELKEIQIILVQSGKTILTELPESLGRYTTRKLSQLGVKVYLEARVSRVTQSAVEFLDGSSLATATVIWAAGLEASLPKTDVKPQIAHKNKLMVQPTLQLNEYANVYAIGDLAYFQDKRKPLSGVAPEALQQGVAVSRNISRQIQGKAPKPFKYFNKGRLAIIGCYAGVGKIGPFLLTGFLPWLMWLSVHLVYLPGFRNRLLVLLNWLHGYGLRTRAVRLILFSSVATNG
jgi:NADH dehydrogenase